MNKELLQKQQALKAVRRNWNKLMHPRQAVLTISHDLRSPVATMSGLSDILKQYLDITRLMKLGNLISQYTIHLKVLS